jgi:hypothetical protein
MCYPPVGPFGVKRAARELRCPMLTAAPDCSLKARLGGPGMSAVVFRVTPGMR